MSAVKAIYAGIRDMGIAEEEDRRDFFEQVTGKRRLREMTPSEKESVVEELRRRGWRKASPRRQISGPYAKKLQALWIAAWNLGLVESREDRAMLAFVKRQTGLEKTEFLREAKQAEKVIEALKSMLERSGVDWGRVTAERWLQDYSARIAWAQWCKLYPAASLPEQEPFRLRVMAVVGKQGELTVVTPAEWRDVCNQLGTLIRKARV